MTAGARSTCRERTGRLCGEAQGQFYSLAASAQGKRTTPPSVVIVRGRRCARVAAVAADCHLGKHVPIESTRVTPDRRLRLCTHRNRTSVTRWSPDDLVSSARAYAAVFFLQSFHLADRRMASAVVVSKSPKRSLRMSQSVRLTDRFYVCSGVAHRLQRATSPSVSFRDQGEGRVHCAACSLQWPCGTDPLLPTSDYVSPLQRDLLQRQLQSLPDRSSCCHLPQKVTDVAAALANGTSPMKTPTASKARSRVPKTPVASISSPRMTRASARKPAARP